MLKKGSCVIAWINLQKKLGKYYYINLRRIKHFHIIRNYITKTLAKNWNLVQLEIFSVIYTCYLFEFSDIRSCNFSLVLNLLCFMAIVWGFCQKRFSFICGIISSEVWPAFIANLFFFYNFINFSIQEMPRGLEDNSLTRYWHLHL